MNPFIIRAHPVDKSGQSIEIPGIFFNSILLHANIGDLLVNPAIETEDKTFHVLEGTWKVTAKIFSDIKFAYAMVRHELEIYIERQ